MIRPNAVSLLAHCQLRWTNIETTSGQVFMFARRAVRIMIHAYRLCLVGTGCTVLCVTKCQVLFSCVLSGGQSGGVIITLYTACQSTVHPSPDMRRAVTDQQTQDIDLMLF